MVFFSYAYIYGEIYYISIQQQHAVFLYIEQQQQQREKTTHPNTEKTEQEIKNLSINKNIKIELVFLSFFHPIFERDRHFVLYPLPSHPQLATLLPVS